MLIFFQNVASLATHPPRLSPKQPRAIKEIALCNVPSFELNIMEPTADIALIGLAVMGQNLILNMNDHGYTVVAFNRTVSKVDDFLNDAAKGTPTSSAPTPLRRWPAC